MYGSELRLVEALRVRIKGVDTEPLRGIGEIQ